MNDLKYKIISEQDNQEFLFSKKQLKKFPKLANKFSNTDSLLVPFSSECLGKFDEFVLFIQNMSDKINCRLDHINIILKLTKEGVREHNWICSWINDDAILKEMTDFATKYEILQIKDALGIIYAQIFINSSTEDVINRFMNSNNEIDSEGSDSTDWFEFM